jgi:dTDP-4-amino-4,6-dideoxygalactose transaminase
VATGTLAVYAAIKALDLPRDSEMIIPPVTDGGAVSAALVAGIRTRPCDSAPSSFNTTFEEIRQSLSPQTKAVMVAHIAGEPLADIKQIVDYCKKNDIRLIEDCSQAVGAEVEGVKVGNFGDVAAFSIMYRKNLSSGGSGGVVYTRRPELFHTILGVCDRGKQSWRVDLNQNDPSQSLFAALNLSWNEFSASVAASSLGRLDETIARRRCFTRALYEATRPTDICKPQSDARHWSPFFMPIHVDLKRISVDKFQLTRALASEGIGLLPQYGCVVSRWPWLAEASHQDFSLPNAESYADSTFNLFLNERYSANYGRKLARVMRRTTEEFLRD